MVEEKSVDESPVWISEKDIEQTTNNPWLALQFGTQDAANYFIQRFNLEKLYIATSHIFIEENTNSQLLSDYAYEHLCYYDKAATKEIVTNFFYWWHNQPGTNTEEGFEEWLKLQARCVECGAKTKEEAATKCICGGDKDFCHGQTLWPED